MDYKKEYQKWMGSAAIDEDTLIELSGLFRNEAEQKARFERAPGFGTSGIRGLMRAGLNGINVYTVRFVTQCLASYIKGFAGAPARGVVIAYDSRIDSDAFAIETAQVLAANGVKVYIFESLRPTPELSFAVRELGCIAGVNITASHNPKEYNGYKVYWEDGAQLTPDRSEAIASLLEAGDVFEDVRMMSFNEAMSSNLISIIGAEVDDAYVEAVLAQSHMTDKMREAAAELKVVFTPFHGAGYRLVPLVLDRIGVRNVTFVEEQMTLDGSFPTVKAPNPENKEGFALAIDYARRIDADLVIGTDPDSDRLGIAIKRGSDYEVLTGNQIGALMLDYIITMLRREDRLPSNAAAVKSIVSTRMLNSICEHNNIEVFEVLPGFKFVGEKIAEWESGEEHSFIFGMEENLGFLTGTYSRDKDAILAAMLMAEIACYYSCEGRGLDDALSELDLRYGHCTETLHVIEYTGLDALDQMKQTMTRLRASGMPELNIPVVKCVDYLTDDTGLPPNDIIEYRLEDGSSVIVRPSGTEPKLKLYIMSRGAEIDASSLKAALEQ